MKTNRGQNTIEYLVFFTGVTVFFIMFLGKGFPYVTSWGAVRYAGSPFQAVFGGILREPGGILGNQIRETSTLDVYGAPHVPPIPPIPYFPWYAGGHGTSCPPAIPADTCSPMETGNPPRNEITDCDPLAGGGTGTYSCMEFFCNRVDDPVCTYWGIGPPCYSYRQTPKNCVGGLLNGQPDRDTCPGTDDIATYQCQPGDNFTCNDVSWEYYIWTHTDNDTGVGWCVGACYMSDWYFFFQRTVECRPFQLPGG